MAALARGRGPTCASPSADQPISTSGAALYAQAPHIRPLVRPQIRERLERGRGIIAAASEQEDEGSSAEKRGKSNPLNEAMGKVNSSVAFSGIGDGQYVALSCTSREANARALSTSAQRRSLSRIFF